MSQLKLYLRKYLSFIACFAIKSKYNINGEEGTIAIVGPKRMEYDRVIGLLEYINEELKNKDKQFM